MSFGDSITWGQDPLTRARHASEGWSSSTFPARSRTRPAECYGCGFLDASDVVTAGADGIHLDADNHGKLAAAVQTKLGEMLA